MSDRSVTPPAGARRPPRVTVTRRTAGEAELEATGDFDVAGLPAFQACLDELVDAGCRQLTVDLTGVSFADASALGVLVRTKRKLAPYGGLRLVYDDSSYFAQLLRLTGLEGALD